MFTKKEIKIDRYSDGDFIVEIVETADLFEAWIGRERYGAKEYFFGIPKGSTTKDKFEELVFANFDKYAKDYVENHF